MQTSVIGFPRIGTLRELKFASEKYFRGEISSQELLDTAKNLRKIHWTIQKNEGIDFIPSNDFSFYDTLLIFLKYDSTILEIPLCATRRYILSELSFLISSIRLYIL